MTNHRLLIVVGSNRLGLIIPGCPAVHLFFGLTPYLRSIGYTEKQVETEINRLEKSREFPINVIIADIDGLKDINDTFRKILFPASGGMNSQSSYPTRTRL